MNSDIEIKDLIRILAYTRLEKFVPYTNDEGSREIRRIAAGVWLTRLDMCYKLCQNQSLKGQIQKQMDDLKQFRLRNI